VERQILFFRRHLQEARVAGAETATALPSGAEGTPSLADFYKSRRTRRGRGAIQEALLLFGFYLQAVEGNVEFSIEQVGGCFGVVGLDLPKNLWKGNRQIVFRRRTADFLDNPKADRLLSRLRSASLILFGVGLERSIRRLALCLLARGFRVAFVPEACGYWNETEGDLARRLIIAKGGQELHLDDLEETFKNATRPRITRIYSKAVDPTKRRRNIAG